MKNKIKYFLVTLGLFMITPIVANASSGTIYLSHSPSGNVTVGNTVTVNVDCRSQSAIGTCEYTLDYDSSKLTPTGSVPAELCYADNDSTTKLCSKSYTFKVISSGTSTVGVKSYSMVDFNENDMSTSVDATTINGVSASSGNSSSSGSSSANTSFSTNNYLSSLAVDGNSLDQEFNKDVQDYKMEISETVEKINITATAEDSKASITGAGEKTLDLGENKYEIVVTSEKGTTKTYTITVNVKDDNPVNIKVNDKEYTIVKKASLLGSISKYEASTINISGTDIPCLINKETNETIVALKEKESGSIGLFIYNKDNNTYKPYIRIAINGLSLTIIDKDETFKNYNKYEIIIGDINVPVFRLNESSYFAVFYARDNNTGEEGYYMYDMKINSIIHYDEGEINGYAALVSNWRKLIIGLLIAIIICIIILGMVIIKKRKNKKQKNIIDNNNETKINFSKPIEKTSTIFDSKKESMTTEPKKEKNSDAKFSTKTVDLKKIELEQNLKLKDQKAIKRQEQQKISQQKIDRIIKKSEEKRKKELSDTKILDQW